MLAFSCEVWSFFRRIFLVFLFFSQFLIFFFLFDSRLGRGVASIDYRSWYGQCEIVSLFRDVVVRYL